MSNAAHAAEASPFAAILERHHVGWETCSWRGKKRHFLAALAIGSSVTVGSTASAEQPPPAKIRIATLAPKQSPWGKVFSALGSFTPPRTR